VGIGTATILVGRRRVREEWKREDRLRKAGQGRSYGAAQREGGPQVSTLCVGRMGEGRGGRREGNALFRMLRARYRAGE